jgi:hypothetical protein
MSLRPAELFGCNTYSYVRSLSAADCVTRLADTGRQAYRHDPVGTGTVPFADVPAALEAAVYTKRAMLEIISRDPGRDIVESAEKLAMFGFSSASP